jgi:hypothetical protein
LLATVEVSYTIEEIKPGHKNLERQRAVAIPQIVIEHRRIMSWHMNPLKEISVFTKRKCVIYSYPELLLGYTTLEKNEL